MLRIRDLRRILLDIGEHPRVHILVSHDAEVRGLVVYEVLWFADVPLGCAFAWRLQLLGRLAST